MQNKTNLGWEWKQNERYNGRGRCRRRRRRWATVIWRHRSIAQRHKYHKRDTNYNWKFDAHIMYDSEYVFDIVCNVNAFAGYVSWHAMCWTCVHIHEHWRIFPKSDSNRENDFNLKIARDRQSILHCQLGLSVCVRVCACSNNIFQFLSSFIAYNLALLFCCAHRQ